MMVDRYGLHWAPGGIPFLVQPRGGTNLISDEIASPFIIKSGRKHTACPHDINLNDWVDPPDWIEDPLAQALLPALGQPPSVSAIEDPDGSVTSLVERLSRLCSPVSPILFPIWWKRASEMRPWYIITNLTPVILTNVELDNSAYVNSAIEYARLYSRNILFVCADKYPLFGSNQWIKSSLQKNDLQELPLEKIGAGALRRYMANAQP